MEGKDNGQKEEPDGTGEPPAPAPPTRETHDPSAASAERPAKVGSAGNPIHIRDPDVGRWTLGLMIWTGGLVGVAIVSAGISYFQWCELQKAGVQTDSTIAALNRQAGATEAQQKLMQQQLDEMRDEQRPWVYSDAPVFLRSITKNPNGVWDVNIQFTLRNTGHLPAFNVKYILDSPIPTIVAPNTVTEYQRKKCTPQGAEPATITGYTVFPGQIVKDGVTIGIWPFDADRAIGKYHYLPVWIIGCFQYKIPGSDAPHFTRFAYAVGQEAKVNDYPPLPIDPSAIPPDQLHVEPFPFEDDFSAD